MKKPIILGLAVIISLSLLTSCGTKQEAKPSSSPLTTPVTSAAQTSSPSAPTAPAAGNQVGNLAPDFQLYDLQGKAVSLSDFRGTPVWINFWATW